MLSGRNVIWRNSTYLDGKKSLWQFSECFIQKLKWIFSFLPNVLNVFVIEQIFKWHWLSCRPNITMELVCDNTFNIDIALGNAADLTWIKGFQVQWLPFPQSYILVIIHEGDEGIFFPEPVIFCEKLKTRGQLYSSRILWIWLALS